MDLIQEIKSDIIDSNKSLSIALRKAKALASKLKNERLKEWVNNELNGYRQLEHDDIPEYRKFQAHNVGDFFGSFQSCLNILNGQFKILSPNVFFQDDLYNRFYIMNIGIFARL